MNKIINFHDVHNSDWFEATIGILKRKYNLLTIGELERFYHTEPRKRLSNSCFITVDDGDSSFYETIYPVLKKHDAPAALFVSPKITQSRENFWFQEIKGYDQPRLKEVISNFYEIDSSLLTKFQASMVLKNCRIADIWKIINLYRQRYNVDPKPSQNMTTEQVKEVDSENLVVIGAHTMDHPVLANESEEDSKAQISSSIDGLEEILGHEIKYFAYPNGVPLMDFGQREIDCLNSRKVRLAFSTEPNNFSAKDNPLAVPRFGLSYGSPFFVRIKLLLGKNWEIIRGLKSKSESQFRNEISKVARLSSAG